MQPGSMFCSGHDSHLLLCSNMFENVLGVNCDDPQALLPFVGPRVGGERRVLVASDCKARGSGGGCLV